MAPGPAGPSSELLSFDSTGDADAHNLVSFADAAGLTAPGALADELRVVASLEAASEEVRGSVCVCVVWCVVCVCVCGVCVCSANSASSKGGRLCHRKIAVFFSQFNLDYF